MSGVISTVFVRLEGEWLETLGFGNKRSDFGRGTGADDETARRDLESDGEEDHLAGSGRDYRSLRPDDAADAEAIRRIRLQRAIRSAAAETDLPASTDGNSRTCVGALPGHVF